MGRSPLREHCPDLTIWKYGTAAAFRTWKRSVASKGWKSQVIGGKHCDSFWAFAGVLHFRTGTDTPAPLHRTERLAANRISCTAL
jgi:hypothetical protein